MSDQDRISPHSLNTISCRPVMRIKKISIKGLLVDSMINSSNYITRTVWQTVRRITNEMMGLKRLTINMNVHLLIFLCVGCIKNQKKIWNNLYISPTLRSRILLVIQLLEGWGSSSGEIHLKRLSRWNYPPLLSTVINKGLLW